MYVPVEPLVSAVSYRGTPCSEGLQSMFPTLSGTPGDWHRLEWRGSVELSPESKSEEEGAKNNEEEQSVLQIPPTPSFSMGGSRSFNLGRGCLVNNRVQSVYENFNPFFTNHACHDRDWLQPHKSRKLDSFHQQTSNFAVIFLSDKSFLGKKGMLKPTIQPSIHWNLYVVLAGEGVLKHPKRPPPPP